MGLHELPTQEGNNNNDPTVFSGPGHRSDGDVQTLVNNPLMEQEATADLASTMAHREADDAVPSERDANNIAAADDQKQIMGDQNNILVPDVLEKQHATASASIVLPAIKNTGNAATESGASLEIVQDNNVPLPIGQTNDTDKESKKKEGLVMLDSNAPHPFEAYTHDDSLIREKEKMKQNEVSATRVQNNIGNEATSSSYRTLDESISIPCIEEEGQALPRRPISRQTETTAATATTTVSEGTIFDAYSQRASEMRCTEDTQIFIPEATIVEESIKEDIPSAEIVIPEKYSITIAGKKVHAGVLILVMLVIIVLVVALSLTLTRSTPIGSSSPTLSRMPSSPPSIQPSSQPTSALYSTLVDTIYGDMIQDIDFNEHRQAAMEWLAEDQASATVFLTDEQLRERYALALLYFVSNADGSWYDDINFLSADHVCNWRMKRSGEKKGILLCDDENKVLQLALCKFRNVLGWDFTIPCNLSNNLAHITIRFPRRQQSPWHTA